MLEELIQEQMEKMQIGSEEWNELFGLRIHASLKVHEPALRSFII